jgi:glycosyltransferase involved in cell wall biosynthesis
MKIVMFTDAYWPRINGVTVSVDSFARALTKQGHDVLILCSYYPESYDAAVQVAHNPEQKNAPKIVRVPSMPAFITKEDRIAKFHKWFWVFRKVELFNPDIIHINTEFIIAEFGFLYARVHNLPAIYTFHTMWEEYAPNYFPLVPPFLIKFFSRKVLKNALRRSFRVIVPTPQIDEVVHKYRPRAKTFLLPTGIDPQLFLHDKAEGEIFREKFETLFPRVKGKRLLLFAGRVAKEKNIGFLLEILGDIQAKQKDVVLVIAGNGPDMDFFKNEAERLGVCELSVFTGYLERPDLALLYTISEVFVFPSLTDTQGLVTLEAMFSGVPVVAIGALGTLMVMGGDNGGFMVKNDKEEFAARVLDLLEDRELCQKKSDEARLHARSWAIDEITKKLVDEYRATAEFYREEYGDPRTPVWELLMDKRWWKINNKIIRKRTKSKWREFLGVFQNRACSKN